MNYSSLGSRARFQYPLEAKAEALSKCKYEDFDVDDGYLFPDSLSLRTRSQRCRSRSSIPRRRLYALQRRDLTRNFSVADPDAFGVSSAGDTIVQHSLARNSARRLFLDEDGRYAGEDQMYADAPWRQQRSAFHQPVARTNHRFQQILASAFKASHLAAPPILVHMPLVCLFMPGEVDGDRRASHPCLTDDSYFQ